MSEAACAEEEEGLKRIASRAYDLAETIRRVEKGEITVTRESIETSNKLVQKALKLLDKADKAVHGNITGCKGCPTN